LIMILRHLSQQRKEHRIRVQLAEGQHVVERPARRQDLISISPAPHGGSLTGDQFEPFLIKRLDKCHREESGNQVLSDVLVETPHLLAMWARCWPFLS
jgi:hypothetical protein